ncbi:LuxR family transcriptional regulator [Mesorhizobium sp. BR1-1-6]|uniref:helix-turn-helix transcriptional regulator n=1 Tax=unclassified Mesorhizobium TaxID=325217 RepID=UPI001CCE1DE0|nr:MULTISPECIES: LuxR family transcriptional regulator [unclassified Mesorhizobium]MBZ9897528.1 LuxR family transcriptional regulator [Mesorhizobium sp. BR1-1-6]MBZ9916615.1 LuxR family transcriptional regulator [Mesorhizobium sp. BR1-1-7]MBZ9952906.1 LuxR family transcriptional regulator [Mesorhizobium sp. BR1-1-15]MBZ9956959.1 LuxR family transcriptional regulator [Mesorhizobium sp. BR1-1-14]MBZ9972567.1 LuxR family transcriptional regulator [Mesorhizobium sp. BR1-1-12]
MLFDFNASISGYALAGLQTAVAARVGTRVENHNHKATLCNPWSVAKCQQGTDHRFQRGNMGFDVAMGQFDRTLEYIDHLQQAGTAAAVCERLLGITSDFGLTALMAGTVPQPGTPTGQQKQHVLLCDWPVEWLERYVARNYVDHDPIVSHMKQLQAPFQWREAAQGVSIDRSSGEVMGDAVVFKLRDGLAFPLITLDGQIVMVSLGGEAVELSAAEFGLVSLVSTYAVGRAMQLHTKASKTIDSVELTPRERECLQWAAVGKSEWEISQILGISEHTSEKHLLNAKSKLGAVNRVQAVAEAIRRGYIS